MEMEIHLCGKAYIILNNIMIVKIKHTKAFFIEEIDLSLAEITDSSGSFFFFFWLIVSFAGSQFQYNVKPDIACD
jgi:hypothetical protein